MNCPKCKTKLEVTDSRERSDGVIYRRRYCPKCGEKYSTRETITDYKYIKEYDKQFRGLLKAVKEIKELDISKLHGKDTDLGKSNIVNG